MDWFILLSAVGRAGIAKVVGTGRIAGMSHIDWDNVNKQRQVFGLAYLIAERAHAGDFRDLPDGRPYFEHVKDVADFFDDWETKTVAILHDAIEDTQGKPEGIRVTEDSLKGVIPGHLIAGVVAMTKPPKSGNEPKDKEAKLEAYLAYVRGQVKENAFARRVKLADNYVNMRDLIAAEKDDADTRWQLHKYAMSIAELTK